MNMQQAQENQQRQIQHSLEEVRQASQAHQQHSSQMHQQGHEVMAVQQNQIQQLQAQQASGPVAPLPEKFPDATRAEGPGTQMLPPPRPPDQPAVVLKRRMSREELLAEGNLCELGLPDEGGVGRQTTVRVTGFDHNRDGVPDALQ